MCHESLASTGVSCMVSVYRNASVDVHAGSRAGILTVVKSSGQSFIYMRARRPYLVMVSLGQRVVSLLRVLSKLEECLGKVCDIRRQWRVWHACVLCTEKGDAKMITAEWIASQESVSVSVNGFVVRCWRVQVKRDAQESCTLAHPS